MKNSLISTSVAVLLASNSIVAFASSVTIPNTFVADTPAVAADVNANFDAVAVGVNDNDSRVTTNTNAISTNTTDVSTNTSDISINTTGISTNAADIATNTAGIATNAADIDALQSGSSCPSDMVAAGSLCVDLYEASVYDEPTGGTKFGDQTDDYPCDDSGSNCGATAEFPIYARSVAGEHPATNITLYQASVACANVGKRLPTTTEWQMAAAGTPAGNGDGTAGCNVPSGGGTVGNTGNAATCVSSAGAFDMVGNVWEWSADLHFGGKADGPTTTDFSTALALGDGYLNNGTASTKDAYVLAGTGGATGPNDGLNPIFGFRCVR